MSRQGFTLVELLVIIAIFGILCSLLVPAVVQARRQLNLQKVTKLITIKTAFPSDRQFYVGTDKGVFEVTAEHPNYPDNLELFSTLIVGKTYKAEVAQSTGIPRINSAKEATAKVLPEQP